MNGLEDPDYLSCLSRLRDVSPPPFFGNYVMQRERHRGFAEINDSKSVKYREEESSIIGTPESLRFSRRFEHEHDDPASRCSAHLDRPLNSALFEQNVLNFNALPPPAPFPSVLSVPTNNLTIELSNRYDRLHPDPYTLKMYNRSHRLSVPLYQRRIEGSARNFLDKELEKRESYKKMRLDEDANFRLSNSSIVTYNNGKHSEHASLKGSELTGLPPSKESEKAHDVSLAFQEPNTTDNASPAASPLSPVASEVSVQADAPPYYLPNDFRRRETLRCDASLYRYHAAGRREPTRTGDDLDIDQNFSHKALPSNSASDCNNNSVESLAVSEQPSQIAPISFSNDELLDYNSNIISESDFTNSGASDAQVPEGNAVIESKASENQGTIATVGCDPASDSLTNRVASIEKILARPLLSEASLQILRAQVRESASSLAGTMDSGAANPSGSTASQPGSGWSRLYPPLNPPPIRSLYRWHNGSSYSRSNSSTQEASKTAKHQASDASPSSRDNVNSSEVCSSNQKPLDSNCTAVGESMHSGEIVERELHGSGTEEQTISKLEGLGNDSIICRGDGEGVDDYTEGDIHGGALSDHLYGDTFEGNQDNDEYNNENRSGEVYEEHTQEETNGDVEDENNEEADEYSEEEERNTEEQDNTEHNAEEPPSEDEEINAEEELIPEEERKARKEDNYMAEVKEEKLEESDEQANENGEEEEEEEEEEEVEEYEYPNDDNNYSDYESEGDTNAKEEKKDSSRNINDGDDHIVFVGRSRHPPRGTDEQENDEGSEVSNEDDEHSGDEEFDGSSDDNDDSEDEGTDDDGDDDENGGSNDSDGNSIHDNRDGSINNSSRNVNDDNSGLSSRVTRGGEITVNDGDEEYFNEGDDEEEYEDDAEDTDTDDQDDMGEEEDGKGRSFANGEEVDLISSDEDE